MNRGARRAAAATINSYHVTALWVQNLSLLSAESHLITYSEGIAKRTYVNPDGRATSRRLGNLMLLFIQLYTLPKNDPLGLAVSPHTVSQRQRLPRPRLGAINPSLVSSGQLCNNILFYLFCMTTRVDRIGRNTQPVDGCVVCGGTVMATRNKHHLIFTSMEVISDNEMMPITFQCGAGFRNKESGISLELINKKWIPSINHDTRIYQLTEP